MLSLRRLSKELEIELPETNSVTIGGVMQDVLQKNSEKGDLCDWGPFAMRVIDFKAKLGLLVELKLRPEAENES
jgi:Mg2+/Co2+ transporter CorB